MKNIIYQDFGDTGSEAATIGIYQLSEAIKKDMILQGRSFKPHTYNKWISEAMNPSNKTAFKQGIRRGEALLNKKAWESSWGKTKGEDLARAIVYTLRNQGIYEWPNVRECVKAMPSPFNKLHSTEYEPEDTTGEVVKKSINELAGVGSLDDARIIVEKLMTVIDKGIAERKEKDRTIKKKNQQVITCSNNMKKLSKEREVLRTQLIGEIESRVKQLTQIRANLTDKRDLEEIDDSIKKARKDLKTLNS